MPTTQGPRIGGWARADGFVGLVTAVDDDRVTLLDPGRREQHVASRDTVEALPAVALRVTMSVDLPVPHGLPEESLRRWVAMLADPVLRDRAGAALRDLGADPAAAQASVASELTPCTDGVARCAAGHTTPAAPGAAVDCAVCGRPAAPPMPPADQR